MKFLGLVFAILIAAFIVQLSGIKFIIVSSDSMWPYIPAGSLIVSKKLEPKVGNVIVFISPDSGEFIVHRVVQIKNIASSSSNLKVYKTKGDQNRIEDPWDTIKSSITGVVVVRVPFLGYLLRLFKI